MRFGEKIPDSALEQVLTASLDNTSITRLPVTVPCASCGETVVGGGGCQGFVNGILVVLCRSCFSRRGLF